MFQLYPVLVVYGNKGKEILEGSKGLSDIGARRDGAEIDRPCFFEVYDVNGGIYVVVDESDLERTRDFLENEGIELDKEPLRIVSSVKCLNDLLGYAA